MLNITDGGRIGAFAVGDDALLHLLRFKSVEAPDNSDDGNVDRGKDVNRCSVDRQDAKDQNQHRHYDERVGQYRSSVAPGKPRVITGLTLPKGSPGDYRASVLTPSRFPLLRTAL